jgi:hypothetical protein
MTARCLPSLTIALFIAGLALPMPPAVAVTAGQVAVTADAPHDPADGLPTGKRQH